MRPTRWLPIVALGAAALCGCEKAGTGKAIVLNPTTRQSAPPATRIVVVKPPEPVAAAASQPATQAVKRTSVMVINQQPVEFPEAKLIVRKDGDKLSAFLVSNDPPEVINPNYQGNRYYFEMKLDAIDDVKNLSLADYVYKALSAEPQDTPNGIFLDGDRQHYQPYEIEVVFDKVEDHLVATIQGRFLYFPKGNVVGTWVPVMAQLAVKPTMK